MGAGPRRKGGGSADAKRKSTLGGARKEKGGCSCKRETPTRAGDLLQGLVGKKRRRLSGSDEISPGTRPPGEEEEQRLRGKIDIEKEENLRRKTLSMKEDSTIGNERKADIKALGARKKWDTSPKKKEAISRKP